LSSKTYYDHGITNGCKNCKEFIDKDDQTNKIRIFWNCEEDDIDDENYKNNKVAKQVEEKKGGKWKLLKCVQKCVNLMEVINHAQEVTITLHMD